jgi:hypothetical protein
MYTAKNLRICAASDIYLRAPFDKHCKFPISSIVSFYSQATTRPPRRVIKRKHSNLAVIAIHFLSLIPYLLQDLDLEWICLQLRKCNACLRWDRLLCSSYCARHKLCKITYEVRTWVNVGDKRAAHFHLLRKYNILSQQPLNRTI